MERICAYDLDDVQCVNDPLYLVVCFDGTFHNIMSCREHAMDLFDLNVSESGDADVVTLAILPD